MGCKASVAIGSKEEQDKNKEIERQLQGDRKKMATEVKLLLLGAGESGKSTIAKQMKIIHLNGFTKEELLSYKNIIHGNVYTSIKALIQACRDLTIPLESSNQDLANTVADSDDYFRGELTPQIAADAKRLWADPGIKAAFARAAEFQLNDSTAFYLNAVDRLAEPGFKPNVQDVLQARQKTTGITEIEFEVEKVRFRVVDVGGQRSERRKWVHCFQDVTSVVFCVAMSEYDLKLYEDDTTNRMHESLRLFREICNNKWFAATSMILFLNKRDIFEEKITKVPLTVCFPEYTGPNEFKPASAYICDQFVQLNENPKKQIYHHVTCATDTSNIQHVFSAVKDIILHKALDESGIGV